MRNRGAARHDWLGAGVFGWVGIYTAAGMRRYDEMDGLIPFFAGVAGLDLLTLAGMVALVAGMALQA